MKTEEIKPGDILYDEERKMLVKVARVDEDGVVKYSAYTDMQRIVKTVPPPYRVGIRTADAYVPATDEQRKYMERKLAVCEYVNLPKDNRIEVLAYIIADLKAENIELEQRVHQLMDDYNNVVRQLNGIEKHEPNTEGYTLGKLTEALDKCETLEKENKMLKQLNNLLLTDRNEKTPKQTSFDMNQLRDHCDKLERENEELKRFAKAIHGFVKDKNIYMAKGTTCGYIQGHPAVCSTACLECDSCLGIINDCGVICEKKLTEAKVSFPNDD